MCQMREQLMFRQACGRFGDFVRLRCALVVTIGNRHQAGIG